jgi:hypothetical protein
VSADFDDVDHERGHDAVRRLHVEAGGQPAPRVPDPVRMIDLEKQTFQLFQKKLLSRPAQKFLVFFKQYKIFSIIL